MSLCVRAAGVALVAAHLTAAQLLHPPPQRLTG